MWYDLNAPSVCARTHIETKVLKSLEDDSKNKQLKAYTIGNSKMSRIPKISDH